MHRSRIHVTDLLGGVLQHPLGLVDDAVSGVDEVNPGPTQFVLLGELLRLGYLLLNLVFTKGGLALYPNRLLGARPEVLRGDVDDAVGIDVEGDLDLRDSSWRGWYAHQVEAS